MSDVTVLLPRVNDVAYFEFKDPFDSKVKIVTNSLDKRYKLTVVSVVGFDDYITQFHRDPFIDVYNPVALSDVEYRQDKNDDIKIITFAYRDVDGVDQLFKVPHNYIAAVITSGVVPYTNRTLVLNLGYLPEDLDITHIFSDVGDIVTTMLGVQPTITDISTGEREFIEPKDHTLREEVRKNTVSVKKTLAVQLREAKNDLDAYVKAVKKLGIDLSEVRDD